MVYSGFRRLPTHEGRIVKLRRGKRKKTSAAVVLLAAFALWTAVMSMVDVQSIGPMESSVGLATLNGCVHRLTGVHMGLYVLTDWLSLVPVGFILGFAWLGLAQWIKRKSLNAPDAVTNGMDQRQMQG